MRCARRGVRVRRPTRPAGLELHSSEQPRSPGTGRRPGLGCTLREIKPLSNSGGTGCASCCQVLEGRKPLFVLRFDGAFLLRFTERTFAGSLLNVPPRRIRGFGRRPLKGHSTKQVAPQAIGIGMAGMSNPTHDPGADDLEPDATPGILPLHPAHPATEAADIVFGNQSVAREDPIAQEADALFAREDDALVPMDLEPQALQKMLDLPLDLVEPSLVVGKDEKVINVADVTQPEMVGDEVIEGVEVDVGEELAGLVA